jgi:protein involved in polysaccharide export with SLBB domain
MMKMMRSIFAVFLFVGISAPVWAGDATYNLGAGDKVRITVFGETDLTGEYEIDGSGVVAFPLIGEVRAGSGTARDLEKRIVAKLQEGYLKNPTVNVEVLTYRPFFIMGEVKSPGGYAYRSGLTLMNAVAMAGGYTYRAKSNIWVLTRDGAQMMQAKEIANGNFRVLPGDTIMIPERFF